MQLDLRNKPNNAHRQYDRDFGRITLADFMVRSAYQMGKTPVLPIFAAMLGADDVLLGLVVSISTMTGMVSKPLFGLLSDLWGRKLWLIIGTLFFTLVPFAYWFVQTPTQLIAIRIIHGTATAIYGPVTVAFVAEGSARSRAERLGWFSNARSLGYVIGPAVGGFLLLHITPEAVFTVIGLLSCLAFVPVLRLRDDGRLVPTSRGWSWRTVAQTVRDGARVRSVWLFGMVEAVMFVALYALKAFLPLYALGEGFNSAEIGLFFAVQEGANIVAKPLGGKLADRVGKAPMLLVSLVGTAITLPLLTVTFTVWHILLLAITLGLWQGILFSASNALIADDVAATSLGVGLGFFGMLSNAGKVVGPLAGGVLLRYFSYLTTFSILATLLVLTALAMVPNAIQSRRVKPHPTPSNYP